MIIFRNLISNAKLNISPKKSNIDWWLFLPTLPILAASLVTMHSFSEDTSFASHQFIVIIVALIVFFALSKFEVRFLRLTWVSVALFVISLFLLILVTIIGKTSHGAESWLSLGFMSFQPSDVAKLTIIVLLAKYFSRRHIEIANIRHIILSGLYAFIIFIMVLFSPDFGSAMTIFLIWFGMVMVSGISKKHLFTLIGLGLLAFVLLWNFGFQEYQKNRIRTFINPLTDIHGAGYNAYQSIVAIGSGELFGKGVGYGTQSRLKFLPEYQTDFIFAAFAEEWGFFGVVILFSMYGIIIWRIISAATRGASNFEILFCVGVAIFFIVHISVNVGMNLNLLPVTGTPLPLMSYGGTHVLIEYSLLGIVMAMRKYAQPAHKSEIRNEFIGPR